MIDIHHQIRTLENGIKHVENAREAIRTTDDYTNIDTTQRVVRKLLRVLLVGGLKMTTVENDGKQEPIEMSDLHITLNHNIALQKVFRKKTLPSIPKYIDSEWENKAAIDDTVSICSTLVLDIAKKVLEMLRAIPEMNIPQNIPTPE